MSCCNAVTYKWKVHNGSIEIISFAMTFVLNQPSLSISRCSSRYEGDIDVSVVSFVSISMG